MTYVLDNWSVVHRSTAWTPPECMSVALQGNCPERSVSNDDPRITTSPVRSVDGRFVTTYSGSVYLLGAVNPDYASWCRERGIELDEASPIRVIEGSLKYGHSKLAFHR